MEKQIEFKKLEIKPEGSWFKRNIWTPHGKRTLFFMLFGSVVGLIFFLATIEGKLSTASSGEIAQNMIFGAFFGLFITNSPCARGKC